MARIPITGNTYPVREELKALGGKWDAERKVWMVPQEKGDEARALVAGGGKTTSSRRPSRPSRCDVCGRVAQWDSRGYPIGDRILRSGECQSCYEERKMGY